MMILNQVTRAFNSRKRRTSTVFRRSKTASSITIDNKVENSKDDCLSLVKKNHTVDADDIISTTSNSSTIDLTPCSSARCVITTSSKSMNRSDSIDSIRIPPVPTLLMALPSDNADNANDITLCTIPSLRRSISIPDDNDVDDTIYSSDDDDDESDFDCDDSCIYAPPPVPFVCVPINFSHADVLVHSQNSNGDIPNNILLLNRPPPRFGDWDAHTIESNNLEDDELSDTNYHTSNRSAAEAAGTNTSSSMTMQILLAGRRHHQARRRHQARAAVLSQNVRQLSSTSIRYSNTNNSTDTRTQQRSTSIRNDDGKQQQQQQQQYQQQDKEDERQQPPQRQPRVVKWNMIR